MNFAEAANFVTSHPLISVGGTAIAISIAWTGAKAGLKACKEERERKRTIAESFARIPEPTPFIPPEQKYRL